MNRVKIEDYIIDSGYDFCIDDFENRLWDLVDRTFIEIKYKGIFCNRLTDDERCFLSDEAEEYRYFWINKAVYDRLGLIHLDFEYSEDLNSEGVAELLELIKEFVARVYELFNIEQKYKDKIITNHKKEGKIIYFKKERIKHGEIF